MKIALFCGAGTISKQLLKTMSKSSHNIMVFSRTATTNVEPDLLNFIDFHTPQSYQAGLELFRPDVVYSSIWCHREADFAISDVNEKYFQSTIKLFEISKKIGTKAFFCVGSSAELATDQLTVYGYYKKKLRETILSMSTTNTAVSWLRPFNVYGRNQPNFSLLKSILNCVKENKVIRIRNSTREFDWISSRDVARGILASFNENILGIHDLGTGQLLSTKKFVCQVFSQLQLPTSKYIEFGVDSAITIPLVANCSTKLYEKWQAIDDIETGIKWSLQE